MTKLHSHHQLGTPGRLKKESGVSSQESESISRGLGTHNWIVAPPNRRCGGGLKPGY